MHARCVSRESAWRESMACARARSRARSLSLTHQAKDSGIMRADLPFPGRNVVLFHMGRHLCVSGKEFPVIIGAGSPRRHQQEKLYYRCGTRSAPFCSFRDWDGPPR